MGAIERLQTFSGCRKVAGAALLGLAASLLPSDADAQRRCRKCPENVRPALTIEAYAGAATFGRFLEQRLDGAGVALPADARHREVRAAGAFTVGGSLGFQPWEGTAVRSGFTWTRSNFLTRDDSPVAPAEEDVDRNDFNAFVADLGVVRYLLDGPARLSPYATAGVAAVVWELQEERGSGIRSTDDGQLRLGALGGLGLEYRATRRFWLRLEVTTFTLGNPFDGEGFFAEAGPLTEWETMDEPDRVRLSRITLAGAVNVGDMR